MKFPTLDASLVNPLLLNTGTVDHMDTEEGWLDGKGQILLA